MPHFLILMAEANHYARWEAADPTAREQVLASFDYFHTELREHGTCLGGGKLSRPEEAMTVRPFTLPGQAPGRILDTGPPVTGPEELCGFYLIDVPDIRTAVSVAAQLPREYSIEVRECREPGR